MMTPGPVMQLSSPRMWTEKNNLGGGQGQNCKAKPSIVNCECAVAVTAAVDS